MKKTLQIVACATLLGSALASEPGTKFVPGKFSEADRQWWAFQPVEDPNPPAVPAEFEQWVRNPIDRFVLARLLQDQLTPSPEASRRELVRRITFDLIGLPPTPEEVEAFVQDEGPDAYEKLVDRLLESPQYGERWAQHWLDLVRYSDSDGYRKDGYRAESWRYRDYVIKSFNADKPYDRFLREQIAGDEWKPGNREALTATMFYRHGVYEYNQRDVEGQWKIMLNDITETTSDVFMGLGLACARCHDHKFDPLLQKDYFRLQAFFSSLDFREDQPVAEEKAFKAYQEKHQAWEKATHALRKKLHYVEMPTLLKHAKGEGAGKFADELMAMVAKHPDDRTPYEKQIATLTSKQLQLDRKLLPEKLPEDKVAEWKALTAELEALSRDKPKPLEKMKFVISDVGREPRPVRIPDSDDAAEIPPGFPTIIEETPAAIKAPSALATTTGRRSALADWLTKPENPLSSRVAANRIWQYHFGRGLSASPNDFGRLGEPPTHPELLDWLTRRFIEDGWRFKAMHRLIVTSATYRQTTRREPTEVARRIDPANKRYWRYPPQRLEAEQIRDAILAMTGELDPKAGGASVDGDKPRRSIYVKKIRNSPDALLHKFNASGGFHSTPVREHTTTPLQALLLFNGDWGVKRANVLARQIAKTGGTLEEQVARAISLAYGRPAEADEVADAADFVKAQRALIDTKPLPEALRNPVVAADSVFPNTRLSGTEAVRFDPKSPRHRLVANSDEALEGEAFTVEAVVRLDSLFADANVRTLVSRWDNNNGKHGWSLGVTSKKSRYTPRNLIVQLIGNNAEGKVKYEVVPSGILIDLEKPYYVAAVIRAGTVTFYAKDLSKPEEPTTTIEIEHGLKEPFVSKGRKLVIGGRDKDQNTHMWDGVIGRVTLSGGALSKDQLLIQPEPASRDAFADWMLGKKVVANEFTWYGAKGPTKDLQVTSPEVSALADFCHVLINANEFMYLY